MDCRLPFFAHQRARAAAHSAFAMLLLLTAGCAGVSFGEPEPGARRHDAHGVEQVWVPAGSFEMGSSAAQLAALAASKPPKWLAGEFASESPLHRVQISQGFWIDRFEISNAAFDAFVAAGGYKAQQFWSAEGWRWLGDNATVRRPSDCPPPQPSMPRNCITWFEAEAYANWRGARLPSEAEWEYAARGPEGRVYPWGDQFEAARCNVQDSKGPTVVGSYPSGTSWVGAEDMAGNVMEWVQDWLDVAYYQSSPALDPTGPVKGSRKVEKGGWWGSNAIVARAAYRHFEDPPEYADAHIGFRVLSPR